MGTGQGLEGWPLSSEWAIMMFQDSVGRQLSALGVDLGAWLPLFSLPGTPAQLL